MGCTFSKLWASSGTLIRPSFLMEFSGQSLSRVEFEIQSDDWTNIPGLEIPRCSGQLAMSMTTHGRVRILLARTAGTLPNAYRKSTFKFDPSHFTRVKCHPIVHTSAIAG
ncbi:hypothetical protein GE21DRAFT_5359 [Neurospora crassa]|uniref:Uncharacterized protein n=1 Tax=Neurospora crassa (strain ATCC 24698 / 74-OR23-1A / CBS 708.71 / DSM 1257 / FGSC 987) TaxID=367110 RepID=A7UWJ1_NEUCR|nr:hypothetical protein NCU11293 [Neurospora crassa OR74A]EDO65178.2 hypothetical protein NCU11293 [Neurospora crassa OR74A]KHE79335.1 hypothetical protein GE21DRAFT_5359 [Neurospora crassa]|eukprot:XP_001728269.2 hypothetical protein NCU11293 [Neurospora crassa OR74A]